MKTCYIINGQVYRNHAFVPAVLKLSDGKIHICPEGTRVPDDEDAAVVDASGKKVVPGFIDVHTHGAVGVDVNGADPDGLKKIGSFFAQNGTTAWLASVLTDTKEQTQWCIDQYRSLDQSQADAAELLGIHLEGPFLAKEYKGAMPEHLLSLPDIDLVREYQKRAEGGIRYITVSPEIPGVAEMIPRLVDLGIVVAIGHSGAVYQQAMRAIEAGASCSTHTCNAMRLLHQHEPAILGAALESDIYCEMICDGLHLHPGIVRLLMKVKGADRMVAVSDSIMAAGLPDGNYHLGVNEVVVKDGDATLASNGTRAGSTLTQDRALRNIVSFTGRTLEEVLPVLTENPAKLLGVFDRKGSIEEGKDADLVILNEELMVEQVFLRGNLLKNRGEA